MPASPSTSTAADGTLRVAGPGTTKQPGITAEAWQWDVWGYYDTAGPIKFYGAYKGNIARRCKLLIGVRPDDDPEAEPIRADDINDPDKPDITAPAGVPIELINQAVIELARIRDRVRGQSGILFDIAGNKAIAGDCRLAVEPDPFEPLGERWQVYSVIELRMSGQWPDGSPRWTEVGPPSRDLAHGTKVWRFHRPHLARHARADSSVMGVLPELEELALVRRSFRGLAKSRVSGAGVLVMPQELGLKPADASKPEGPSQFAVDLVKHMSTPLKDENSAANLVPHFLTVPNEYAGPNSIRHIPFTRPADMVMDTREDKSIKGIATGVDAPPEVILGIGNTNHWNAAQVTEDTWKAHGEPDMLELAQQVCCMPLRALLASNALPLPDGTAVSRWTPEQIGRIVVVVDASAVIEHPDHGKDAKDLHDRYVISDSALRESNNFTDEQAPDEAEIAARTERYRLEHARGSEPQVLPEADVTSPGEYPRGPAQPPLTTPQGPSQIPAPVGGAPQASGPRPALTAAATPANPGRKMADLDLALVARLHSGAQSAVRRNLERAGARIKSKAQRNKAVSDATRDLPTHLIAASVGPNVVQSLGITESELAVDFNDYLADADARANRARDAGLAAFLAWARAHGRTPTDAQLTEWKARAVAAQQAGRAVLAAGLSAYATRELFSPSADDVRGEGVQAGTVPPAIIRAALAAYGGQHLDATGRTGDDSPLRGVAGGALNLRLAAQVGAQAGDWQWVHGDPEHPFEPHENLDGQIFNDGDSGSGRANTGDSWLGVSDYYPGDHDGCTCFALPLLGFGDTDVQVAA